MGRFEILGVVGEGHHATVCRAYDPLLERYVALKLSPPGVSPTPWALERFLGEVRALARLRHPRIVPIYEPGYQANHHYIAMALIKGHSLAQRIAQSPLSYLRAAEVIAELAEALAYVHDLGIIHRDVKPANVRLDDRSAVYLMDFGIGHRPDSGEIPTPPGTIRGTPAYLAPKLAKGDQPTVLPASDQCSLGTILYELLCGQPPFYGSPSSVLFHAIYDDLPSPRVIDCRIPRALVVICRKSMAKNPDHRYPSCHAFASNLHRWLRGRTPLAYRI